MNNKSGRPISKAVRRRSAARLAAVQALYQVELTGATPDGILRDFADRLIGGEGSVTDHEEGAEFDAPLIEPDSELFTFLVRGSLAQREELDEIVAKSLSGDWSMERLEAVLRNVLRAGAYELKERRDVPARVAISEYVDVAKAFYAGSEPGLVNAVLDRIARVLRAEELGGDGSDARAR
ncbi:transcription antitermination factor NusB [Telmatospirillum sp. J64-1]|uniref:transcription antitermination factor NusB n=1 Tax=Telmatospirillum sp. J64-1 TaxID=2502183 RepID=UPI00115ECE9E|nr:transcription antitermination factor NusB [Telmatospirillum sp. J64-1]